MSAFTVTEEHIQAILTAGLRDSYPVRWDRDGKGTWTGELTPMTAQPVGQMLWAQNYESVNYRYQEQTKVPRYHHGSIHLEPVAILKMIDCYEYQACETEDWESTEAYRFCQAMRSQMIHRLPGYAEAPWAFSRKRHMVSK